MTSNETIYEASFLDIDHNVVEIQWCDSSRIAVFNLPKANIQLELRVAKQLEKCLRSLIREFRRIKRTDEDIERHSAKFVVTRTPLVPWVSIAMFPDVRSPISKVGLASLVELEKFRRQLTDQNLQLWMEESEIKKGGKNLKPVGRNLLSDDDS